MSTMEFNLLREELAQWVSSLDDSSLLNLLNSIKLSRSKTDIDWWDELTDDQKKNIQLGLKDLEEGRILSSQAFRKRLRQDG